MREKCEAGVLQASLLLDGEDRILEGNREVEIFLERPLEEVRKASLREVNPMLYGTLKDLLAKTRRGRGVENYAMAYRLGKRLLRLSVSITPYPLEALGSTGSMVTITTTLPGAAQEPRRRGAAQLAMPLPEGVGDTRGFLERVADPAFLLDREANLVYVNAAMCRVLGHTEKEVLGRPLSFFLAREKAKKTLEYLAETVQATPWRGELEFKRPDGTVSVVAVTVLLWGEGEEAAMLGLGRDVTSEARLERERDEELRRVWSLLDSTASPLLCFTPDYRVTLISGPAEELLDISRDRAIGATLGELFPPEAAETVTSLAESVVMEDGEREATVTLKVRRKRKEMRLLARPAYRVGGRTREYVMVLEEVTGESEETRALRERLESLEWRERVFRWAAGSGDEEEFLGHGLEFLEDLTGYAAGAAFLLEEGGLVLRSDRRLGEEERGKFRRLDLRPGSARLCRERGVFLVQAQGGVPREGWEEVASALERPDVTATLFREKRWRSLLVLVLRSGEEVAGALTLADVTPEKVDEVGEGLLETLGREMGEAIYAIRGRSAARERADEEPGAGLPGDVEAAGGEGKGGDPVRQVDSQGGGPPSGTALRAPTGEEHYYLKIARDARGGDRLPDHLNSPKGGGVDRPVLSPRGIDLAAVVRDLRDYYSRRGRAQEIFLELEEDLPRVHVDKRLLQEALMCLLDNAFRYSPPGSPVVLGVERWGDEIILRVEDQGPGLPEEVVRELSGVDEGEPVGTRECKVGSLLVCRRFVRSMGGELSFKVVPGEGTVSYIRLPVLPFVSEVS